MSDRVLLLLELSLCIGLPMLALDEFLINPSASVFLPPIFPFGPKCPIWAWSTLLGVGSNVVGPIHISTVDRCIELGLLNSLGQF